MIIKNNEVNLFGIGLTDYTFVYQDLDKSKLHLYLELHQVTHAGGKKETLKNVPIKKCLRENMQNDFERSTFDNIGLDKLYCLDTSDPDVVLKASRDDELQGNDHTFWVVKAEKCSEKTRQPGDPACSSDAEIEKYLDGKAL